MRALLWNGGGGACEAARLRASLALDGELAEIQLLLRRHLDRCPECLDLVGGMRAATASIRSAPLEARPSAPALGRRTARCLPWPNIAVAMATPAVGALTLPHVAGPADSGADAPRLAASPPRLPIGRRSAGDDFLVEPASPRRS